MYNKKKSWPSLKSAIILFSVVALAISGWTNPQFAQAADYGSVKNVAASPTTHWTISLYLSENNRPNAPYATLPGIQLIRMYQRDTASTWPNVDLVPTIDDPARNKYNGELFHMPVGAWNPVNKNHYTYFYDPNGNNVGYGSTLMVKSCEAGTGTGCIETTKVECFAGNTQCIDHDPYAMDFNADGNGAALYGVPGRANVDNPATEQERMSILIYKIAENKWENQYLPKGIGDFGEHYPERFIPALAFDNTKKLHIAFGNVNRDGQLYHAYYNGNIGEAYDNNKWVKEVVDTNIGRPTSYSSPTIGLAINPLTNAPVLSYYDLNTSHLKHAYKGSDGNWRTVVIDDTSTDVGFYNSIGVDSGGIVSIAYGDTANDKMKYAYYNGSWHVGILDSEGQYVGRGAKLKVGSNNHVYLLYARVKPGTTLSEGTYEWVSGEITHPATADKGSGTTSSGTGRYRCGKDRVSLEKFNATAAALRKELEGATNAMSRAGVTNSNFREYHELYLFCDYPIDALLRYKFFSRVISPRVNWNVYKNNGTYKANIFKTIPNWNYIMKRTYLSYYATPRKSIAAERNASVDLRNKLDAKFGKGRLKMDGTNWFRVVNAYLYGGYSVDDVARAIKYSGKVVHPWMPKFLFKNTNDYKTYSVKPI